MFFVKLEILVQEMQRLPNEENKDHIDIVIMYSCMD